MSNDATPEADAANAGKLKAVMAQIPTPIIIFVPRMLFS
jgi:hypothetical protein